MRFSSWLGSVHSLFIRRFSGIHRKRRQEAREQASVFQQVETLEQRRVLAFDFVSAYVADDAPFYVTNVTTEAVLSEAPQQIALQFTPGVEIDSSSLAGGVKIERSGGADDPLGEFGSFDDVPIDLSRGALVVDDAPSQNQVVIRFPETLPDDIYRITLSSTVTVDPTTQQEVVTGLQTVFGEAFRGGDSFSFDVRLSLGQQVAAVVPQPISRDPANFVAGLSQDRDSIEVYFNDSELLDQASAETVGFYRLIAVDEATGADIPGSEKNPSAVVYDGAAHKATLAFTPGDIADDMLYRLEIGGSGIVSAPVTVAETATDHDSFATAETLGVVSQAGLLIAGSIDPRAEIDMPGDLPSLYYPTQEGTVDEPGHRVIPVDDTTHGLPEVVTSAPPAAGGFSIDLSFGEGLTPEAIEVSQLAAERWERVIVGDLTDQVHPTTGLPIDDMFITVQAGLLGSSSTHDEPGGTLANARPLDTRSPSDANPFLPFTGEIGIDMADASNPGLFDIMVHEIGHALGFTGGVFNQLDLVAGAGFIGANALREYLSLGVVAFASAVPIETDGGGGTAGSHWDEVEFGSELMTGYINETNPVSRITVGAFDDLGYVVDYSQADAYLSLLPEPLGTAGIIHTIPYNFRNDYGFDPQGNPLNNTITAEQQLRVREIFDLFSRYAGIRFFETADQGITVATGDTRAISDNSPTTSINGIASGSIENGVVTGNARAIINANRDWGESEYGGAYFREAIRQIGQVLGLWHSYDLPSVMGGSLPGENVFPSDYDILHLQQLYPRAGTEIDVYSFTLADDGQFRAETFAQRQAAEASTLDTVLSVYDVGGSLISRNDDSFGRDSRVALELAAGDYYVAVSSAGNTGFNLDVTNSGLGGLSQGEYDLRLDHTPVATASTTIVDASGTPLDGDRDGKAGGAFNFHFRTAATANTIYVDKIASDALIDVSVAAANALQIELDDTTGIAPGMLVFGEGIPDGTTVASNDTATQLTLSTAVTVAVNTKLRFVTPGDGTLANPFLTISDALAAATGNTAIIRVVGNDGSELTGSSNTSGRPSLRPNALVSDVDPYHYYVGRDSQGNPLADGTNLTVPAGVTLMIDAGATLRMAAANVEVGSSSELVSRAGAALQVLGTPEKPVAFSSTLNDPETAPGSQAGQSRTPQGGDWGGLVLRADSDWQPATQASLAHDTLRPVLNSISNAVISHAGGQVVVDAELQSFAAIQIEDTRPTVAFSTVTYSAGAAVSATPNSFEESNGRVGPEFRGNTLLANSTNGVFIAIATEFGSPLDKLDVSARFASTEVAYVLQESLVLAGGSGSYYEDENGDIRARASGRLQIDPGVVVKLQSSRIELERGASQLIAEGVGNDRVIFTSLGDNRFGAGGDFDTNGNLPNKFNEEAAWTPNGTVTTGDWGGIVLNAGASASIADAYLTFGGGEVPIEGGLDDFNVIEVHQADLRLVNTRIEANASGLAQTNRNHRGTNQAATVFVLGAQPIIVGNDFRNNAGAMTSVNANSLNDLEQGDSGRQTGFVRRYEQYDDNRGPLLRGNLVSYETNLGDALAGLAVRAEEITVESVWDDTDIVHVVTDEIIVNNFHTATGLRLESDTAASLVVKLDGPNAGFTASGELLDIDDRIGGTVQVIGQPGFPVVLTSLADDSVGASVDLYGFPVTDTNLDGIATVGTAGDWRSLKFLPLANDRNVDVLNETELPYTSGQDENNVVISAEALGILAPNYATGTNTWESAQEKTGDENRRQGFEVHGAIAYDDPTDVDIYTFDGYAGSEVWIDVDKTSSSLDTMVELLDASGRVLARSADSQTDTGSVTGVTVQADAGGLTTVAGEQAAVIGTAAAATGVGAEVDGIDVTVTGVAARATGYQAQVIGIGARANQGVAAGGTNIVLDDATGVRIGATPTLDGVIAPGSQVTAVNGNTITLDQQLIGNLNQDDWIVFDISGITAFGSSRIVFDVPPEVGVWVGDELSGNTVQSVEGMENNIAVLGQAIVVVPDTNQVVRSQSFSGGGSPFVENGVATDAQTGIQGTGNRFYRLQTGESTTASNGRTISFENIAPSGWAEVDIQADIRFTTVGDREPANGHSFVIQDSVAADLPDGLAAERIAGTTEGTDQNVNQLGIHFDLFKDGSEQEVPHLSVAWGNDLREIAISNWADGAWHDVGITVSERVNGVALTVTLDGQPLVENRLLPGYTIGRPTRLIAGAAAGAGGDGTHDVDNIRVESTLGLGSTSSTAHLGLAASARTAGAIFIDNATPISIGSTVNGTATEVTDVELLGGASAVNAEPNDTLSTAYRTPIAITAGGLTSQFVQTGFIGDGTNTSRDVDMYRLSLPASAAGATMTLEGSTVGLDPSVAMSDVYLRVFDATGTVVAFDDDSGPGLDSSITFTVPGTYDGSGYFVGVSGFANSSYDPRVSGSGIAGSTGSYILRGTFDVPFNVGIGGGEGVVTLDNPVTVSDDQILTFSLTPGQTVSTSYITVDDASQVAVGAQITGAAGIPDGTTVTAVDLATNTLQLSQPISISLDDLAGIGFVDATVTVADASTLAEGMTVIGDGIPAGTTIAAGGINGNELTLSQPVDVADGQFLQFGFLGAAITTDTLYVDDTAATVGATVAAASDPATALATVSGIDVSSGAIELDADITVADGDLLIFSFAGQPVTSRRVVLDATTIDDATKIANPVLVNLVGANALNESVPDGTTVSAFDAIVGSSILELSGSATLSDRDSLGFGFAGTDLVLADIEGIEIGEVVTGPGVPAGTTVVDTTDNNPGLPPNTVVLSQAVNVEDAAALTFNVQEFSVLDAAGAAGVAVLPGSISGVLYDGNQAIQTFTSNRNGDLVFTAVGNPVSRATSGSIDYATGGISLTFNTPPRRAIELRDVAFEYSSLALETLGFAPNASTGTWENGAFPLAKDAWRGGDYYTTNPRDAGMRVTLPGTQGSQHKYFIRVRSQPAAGADATSHEANLVNEGLLNAGQTSGSYELRVRTRQRDDKPGSTVQYADIRYPQIGIDVLGLPNNSPLVGTTGEHPNDNNNTRGNAQQVGNLLTSDRNTISIAGAISDEADVDWYQFSLTYEDIQSLSLHNNSTKTWATVFDIDYADGFRGDLTLSVFDSSGALIYVGRDSNITDDQPGPGQGNDFDDLSRGSLGVLDPFIGSVQLPAGSTTPMTYYVAVSSNERLPSALDQTFERNASDPLARLEPVNSVRRVVEDHIGNTGYQSSGNFVASPGIIDVTDLSANVREFTLADLTLYVTTGSSLYTYNPMTGSRISTIAAGAYTGGSVGDIDMRTDGRLFQYFGNANDNANVGLLREINPGTGAIESSAGDAVPSVPATPAATDWWKISGSTVDALAIRRTAVATYTDSVYYSIRDGVDSVLFHGQTGGSAAVSDSWAGRRGEITGPGLIGNTTGLQFLQDTGTLYGVSDGGQFYQVSTGSGDATNVTDFSAFIVGEGGFQGLAAGPVNLYEGALRNTFFAITGTGKLVCIDPTGASDGSAALIDNLFDTDGDGIGDSYLSNATVGGARGLAFSPLDFNLWHDTGRRGGSSDRGHGIQTTPDNSRNGWNLGGTSMYFGIEEWAGSSQFGMSSGGSYNWLQDLTAGGIGGNYDAPGGAHGSLITNSFSLAGSEYADKPTLYFNYFLETENFDPLSPGIRDSARAFASTDGGLTWTLLATNNSVDWVLPGHERPWHLSVSSRIGTAEQQRVQELFDNTGTWRQARVDLGEFAGESNIQLRFDFATAGEMNSSDISNATPAAKRVVDSTAGGLTGTAVIPLDSVEGLEVDMIVRGHAGTAIDSGRLGPVDDPLDGIDSTIVAIDRANSTITLAQPIRVLGNGTELTFFKQLPPKNNVIGAAATAGDTGGNNTARGINNNFEGFYIDDIIVGFAERGEMVTSSSSNLTTFYDIATPISTQYPEQTLEGEYQLEIRRGTEYGATPVQTTTGEAFASRSISVERTFNTNDRLVASKSSPTIVLAEASLSEVDGIELIPHGNGQITATGSSFVFDDEAAVGSTTHSMLAWNVDLSGQTSAFLNFAVALGDAKVVTSLPDTFVYNAWNEAVAPGEIVGLPAGDGVAVSVDGGTNWTTVDNFAWTGSRVVDLASRIGAMPANTIIGFFRSGEVAPGGDDSIAISSLVVTAGVPVSTTGTIGDSNNVHEFEQGQFVVQNNIITGAARYGVRIDAGRDTATDPDGNYTGTTNAPHLGVPRNTPVLNNSGLVPGVVVANNVISGSGDTGLVYAGSAGGDQVPESAVPFGRIFNNTIVGAPGGQVTLRVPAPALPQSDQIYGAIHRAQLDTQFSEIHSITIYDSGRYDGGAKGILSGLDVDAIMLSQGRAGTYGELLGLSTLDVFDFTSAGVQLSLGTMRPGGSADVQGDELAGTAGGEIDNSFATLGAIDATFINAGDPETRGFVSLGDNGSITFTLTAPLVVSGELYLYATENTGPESVGSYIEVTGVPVGQATGIALADGASPTLLNNVFAELGTGVQVEGGGTQQPVISTSAFYRVGTEVNGATQTQGVSLTTDPFVNAAVGNFYPSANTPIVDSSLNSLQDRNGYAVFKEPLGIAASPIVTPARDVFGQVRADDPDQANAPGLGLNVFKDRGAIERIDFKPPTAHLVSPLDQSSQSPFVDQDSAVDAVRLAGKEARGLQQFAVQLDDVGVGLDRSTVVEEAIKLRRDGVELVEGLDYLFQFNANTNQVVLASPAVFPLGDYSIEIRSNVELRHFLDLAGNSLRANSSVSGGSYTAFDVSLADVPSRPAQFAAYASDGEVELHWQSPVTAASSPVTEYEIQFSDNSGLSWNDWTSSSGQPITASPATIVHANNLDRLYRVRAVNSLGSGDYTSAKYASPSEPQAVNAVVNGEEAADLTWTVPLNNGGKPVVGYAIDKSADGGLTWQRVHGTETATTSATVTGLNDRQPGVATGPRAEVIFRVAAVTDSAVGSWSGSTVAIQPEGRPDAPTGVDVSFDDIAGVVTLSWTVPYDGEQPISDYIVYIDGVDQSGEVIEEVDETTRRTSFAGLHRGQTYSFEVQAANVFGNGEKSEAVELELAPSAPVAPLNLVAIAGNLEVSLSWNPPADTGGLPIESYVVEYATSESGPWQVVDDPDSTDQVATVTSLVRNTPYWFRVAAINSEGVGTYAVAGPVAPTGTPEVPSGDVTVAATTPSDGTVDLAWVYNPDPTGEQQVTGYDVYQREAGAAWPLTPIAADVAATTFSVTSGLVNGVSYEFQVIANNDIGDGASGQSIAVVPRVPADTPTDLVPTVGDGSVSLSWTAPGSNGGTPVTDYVVEYSSDSGVSWNVYSDGFSSETNAVVENLTNGNFYRFRVAALTGGGSLQGAWSAETRDVESVGLPIAPTDMTATPVVGGEGGTINISWTAPTENGGRPIDGYTLQYAEFTNGSAESWQDYAGNLVAGTSATVTGLTNGQAYVFRVAAVTAHGIGLFTEITPPAIPSGELLGPINLRSSSSQTSITLAWDEPEGGYGAGTAVNYEVEISLGNQSMTKLTNGARWTTFSGLTSGTSYQFRVRAVLPGGLYGDWSLLHEATTS